MHGFRIHLSLAALLCMTVGAVGSAEPSERRMNPSVIPEPWVNPCREFNPFELTLGVRDLKRSLRWYQEVLGFELLEGTHSLRGGPSRRLQYQQCEIEPKTGAKVYRPWFVRLIQVPRTVPRISSELFPVQIGLTVDHSDLLYAHCKAKGAVFVVDRPKGAQEGAVFIIRDPDGHRFELIQSYPLR